MYDPIYDLFENGYGKVEALTILKECGVKITLERVAACYENYNHLCTDQSSPSGDVSYRPTDTQLAVISQHLFCKLRRASSEASL